MLNKLLFSILFYFIFVFPSFISLLFNSSSKRVGLYVSIIITFYYILIQKKLNYTFKLKNILLIIFLMLFVNLQILILSISFSNIDTERYFFSFLLMSILLIVSLVFVDSLFLINDKVINTVLNSAFIILSMDLIFSILDGRLLSSQKELYLFQEPSHFSLIYIPVTNFIVFKSKFIKSVFLIFLMLIASYYIKSLTLLLGCSLITFSFFARKRMYKILFLFISLFAILVFSTPYFKERISFNEDNLNLSLLIFLDGWERAYLANILTDGFGIGFNQLGFYGITGFFRELMFNMNSKMNLFDGGSTSCKVVAEFGLLGLILILSYLIVARKYFLRFFKTPNTTSKEILTYSFFIGSFLELFVRGTGYFNPGIIMLFIFLIMNEKLKRKKI